MDSAGFTTTRIVAPDGWDVDALATDMLNDKALMDAVYAGLACAEGHHAILHCVSDDFILGMRA